MLSINAKSLDETLVIKLFEQDMFGRSTAVAQALLAMSEFTHDGQPMGFDLTLQQMTKKKSGRGNCSVAIEVMYNPLS